MPDVAMATASFNQLELEESAAGLHDHQSEIELDLGDGQNYMGQGQFAPYYYSSRYFPHRSLRDPREY
ncbi:hypothetical protein B566_EDAN006318 [Ephemera danica]|nr:hypothetical protein B566_EDAN006318 [Ephemera danica]